ncbi:protein kinase [Mariniblastus sp.]|nr:protein kinase [Mariniblastus sp.]MDA7902881.1 protein kinase [Mariniblastus sp.]MDA7925358.1 protein kinase [Mariniblastus sp.]MDB4480916.1 protein kinase [bacterium]MDB4564338.1 protein kinase [Mariniblastus sp.]
MDSTRHGNLSDTKTSDIFEIKDADPDEYIEATSRYQLSDEIGRGGMGVVFRARDLDLNRDVAVKLLSCGHGNSDEAVMAFIQEAKIMGRLQHPGVVRIYEFGRTAGGRPFHVMKLVEGETLGSLIRERSNRENPSAQLLRVFSYVCQVMAYTHSQHFIHLDLKPANIMVGEFGEVHLMDWGLARSVDSDEPSHQSAAGFLATGNSESEQSTVENGRVHGTLPYMAPEQANGGQVNKRTDVFCLGAILCEILTGRPPYLGDSAPEVLQLAKKSDLSNAYARLDCSVYDKALIRLAKLCLQPNPSDRPWDAAILAKEMAIYSDSALDRLKNDISQFFELSLDLFCIAGFDGYFRRVNANFNRVLGYTERELLARPFLDFVHPDDREATKVAMAKLEFGEPVFGFTNRYVTKSREVIEFDWSAKSVVEKQLVFAVARHVK